MEYFVASDGITGKGHKNNKDGLVMKHGEFTEDGINKDILLAVVIQDNSNEDKRGLLSSAYVRSFTGWYENEIDGIVKTRDFAKVKRHWKTILENARIITSGLNSENGYGYRAAVTAVLMIDDRYISVSTVNSHFSYIGKKYRKLCGRINGCKKAGRKTGKCNREPLFREGRLEDGMYVVSTNPLFMQCNEELLAELAGSFKEPGKESIKEIFMKMSEYMDNEKDSVTVIARPVHR